MRTTGWPAADSESPRNWSRVMNRMLGRVTAGVSPKSREGAAGDAGGSSQIDLALGELDDSNVLGFLALPAGGDVELDALTLVEALVALADDVGEVDEHIVALLT